MERDRKRGGERALDSTRVGQMNSLSVIFITNITLSRPHGGIYRDMFTTILLLWINKLGYKYRWRDQIFGQTQVLCVYVALFFHFLTDQILLFMTGNSFWFWLDEFTYIYLTAAHALDLKAHNRPFVFTADILTSHSRKSSGVFYPSVPVSHDSVTVSRPVQPGPWNWSS